MFDTNDVEFNHQQIPMSTFVPYSDDLTISWHLQDITRGGITSTSYSLIRTPPRTVSRHNKDISSGGMGPGATHWITKRFTLCLADKQTFYGNRFPSFDTRAGLSL